MSGRLARRIAAFELLCQRRRDLTSTELGRLCLPILKECAKQSRPEDIETQIHQVCDRLEESVPWAIVIKNFCTRVIQMLNEEMNSAISTASPDTVHRSKSLLELLVSATVTFDLSAPQLPPLDDTLGGRMATVIDEIVDELPTGAGALTNWSTDYIHDGDLLLTVGASQSVCGFFKSAAKTRRFRVFVTEHAPVYDGVTMANDLRAAGVDCTVIPDAAVCAIMPRVTTVFCKVRAIFADGTLITPSFVHPVMLAARHHSKPVIVLYWKHELTDRFLRPCDSFTNLGTPSDVAHMDDVVARKALVLNPDGECVPANLVTLLINEDGPHGPADIFPLVQAMYRDCGE